jgi:3-oxoacyl-[acyl-carrier-protein] synthase-1
MMARLAVLASGMVTGLGFNAPATLAALRAGISAIRETPWYDFESGEALRGAKVALPHWWEGIGKLADLVAPAIHECLRCAAPTAAAEVPLLIGVAAASRPGRVSDLDERLLDEVEARLGLQRQPHSQLIAMDQVGCAHALAIADQLIREHKADRVVVAGVDSFLQRTMLESFNKQRRLMTPTNSNGFFPGEAGCAILVGEPGGAHEAMPTIIGLGMGQESATIQGTDPLRATGLTHAVRQALDRAGLALKDVALRLTDLSGEHYKFKEAAFVAGRLNGGEREQALDLWHPIEFLGEIGAAILPCLLAQAAHARQYRYAPGPFALCHVGSDDGGRAALIVDLRGGAT